MSQVLASFRSAVGVAVSVPSHAAVVIVAMLAAFVASVVFAFVPIVGPIVGSVVVTPLLLAAALGSADAARHGESAVEGLERGVSEAGVSLVGAYGLLYAAMVGLSLVCVVAFVLVTLVTAGLGSLTDPAAGSLFGGVLGILLALGFGLALLVGLLVTLAVQFVGPAAVVAGTGAVDSVATSYRFFRRNFLGVLGFSAVVFGLVLLAYVGAGAGFLVGSLAADRVVALVLAGLGYVVAFAVFVPVFTVYQVEYFDAVADESVMPPPEDRGDDAGEAVGATPSDANPGSVGDRNETAFEFDGATEADDRSDGDSADSSGVGDRPGSRNDRR